MKKKFFKQTITIKHATKQQLTEIRKGIREKCKAQPEGPAVVAFDQPSPSCGPGENC